MAMVADSTDSPSTISVNRPYRSAMWPRVPGRAPVPLGPDRHRQLGDDHHDEPEPARLRPGTEQERTQPTCTTLTPAA